MALSITHAFVSPVADLNETGIVGPDDWNAAHGVGGSLTPAEAQDLGLLALPETRSATGTITVDSDTDDHILCGAGACTVNLPASALRVQGRPYKIVDYGLDADSNAKTIVPSGVETIVGLSTYILNFRGASVYLFPREDGTGWYI